MNLQVFVIVLASGSVQLSDANLAQIAVALLYLLAFLVPSGAVPKLHRLINFFALGWLVAANLPFGVDFAAKMATMK